MSELRDERPGPIVEDLPIWLGSSDSRSYSKAVSKKFNENLRFPNDSSQNLKEPQGQDISQADPRCLAVQQGLCATPQRDKESRGYREAGEC